MEQNMNGTVVFVIVSLVTALGFSSAQAQERERVNWREVRMVSTTDELPENCEFVANVENRMGGVRQNQAVKRMLRQAGNRGANYVVVAEPDQTPGWAKAIFTGHDSQGEAFFCGSSQ